MHDLLANYLSNRSQFTECNGVRSETASIKCGVPQGTLGPLLFSLYVNDLPIHTMLDVNLFADDTILILKSKSIDQLQEQANEQLNGIDKWIKCNRLSIN